MKRKLSGVFELNRNKKKIKRHNIKNVNNDYLIPSYLKAIDDENKNEIKLLYKINSSNNIEKDIVYEMYDENKLNCERFQFIKNNCIPYLTISSSLIKKIMIDNNKELLEIFLKIKNFMIILLLLNYLIISKIKYQFPILNSTL